MTSALNVLKSVKKGEMFQLQEWKHDEGDSEFMQLWQKIELEKKLKHEVSNCLNVYIISHAHVMVIILQGTILTNCDINYLLW